MTKLNYGNVSEEVIAREDFSLEKAKNILKDETIAILGYGVQGPAQALNLKDNGFRVIVGQREGTDSWKKAVADGWEPNKTLFPLEEAAKQGTFICFLLSDAGQIKIWPTIKKYLTSGKTLCFSHGFGICFKNETGIVPSRDIDLVLIAPKGSGKSVRDLFLKGKGINASYAVAQDATGKAQDKAIAYGIGIGSGYLFQTTFKNEVFSDLTGERGVLMGALAGLIEAQYEVLRKHGHSPSEAFNETVEELTQSLMPLVAENGMDWMFRNCSTTAQRGALDWLQKFKATTQPLFEELYESVASGKETKRVIDFNNQDNYRALLEAELKNMSQKELWQVGKVIRKLRPKEKP